MSDQCCDLPASTAINDGTGASEFLKHGFAGIANPVNIRNCVSVTHLVHADAVTTDAGFAFTFEDPHLRDDRPPSGRRIGG